MPGDFCSACTPVILQQAVHDPQDFPVAAGGAELIILSAFFSEPRQPAARTAVQIVRQVDLKSL
jgi:hypothetical protein